MAQRTLVGWWRNRSKIERCLLGSVGVVLVLCVVTLVGRRLWRSYRISRELARIRAAEEPASAAELQRMYEGAASDSSKTRVWRDAVTAVRRAPAWNLLQGVAPYDGDAGEPPQPGRPWTKLPTAVSALKQLAVPIEFLHAAAEQGGAACYDVQFEDGFFTTLEHVQDLREGGRLLALESHVRAHQDDPKGAAKAIHAIFATARSLEHEPCVVSQMVRMACDQTARTQIRRLIPAVEFSDEQLFGMQADLRAAHYRQGMQCALQGERVMGITAFKDPKTMGLSGTRIYAWHVLGGEDELRYLGVMRRITAGARLPWPEAVAAVRTIDREIRTRDVEQRQGGGRGWFRTPATVWGVLGGDLAKAIVTAAQHTALNRAADTAIAVERFRRRHGRLPERLDELVPDLLPELPEDPFTGEPLCYLPGDESYVVYSVGPDGVDNGGTGQDTVWLNLKGTAEGEETDLVFRVEVVRDQRD